MPGNSTCVIVLTDRDRLLLKELATAKVSDREQAKKIAGFNSTTRANDRLLKLTRAGFLRRFFLGTRAGGTKAIYSLSTKGAQIVQVEGRLIKRKNNSLLVGDLFVEHQLAVNSVWIQTKFTPIPVPDVQFSRWLTFPSALSKSTPLMPDGYFELKSTSGMYCLFCEVDRGTESLKVWSRGLPPCIRTKSSGLQPLRKLTGKAFLHPSGNVRWESKECLFYERSLCAFVQIATRSPLENRSFATSAAALTTSGFAPGCT